MLRACAGLGLVAGLILLLIGAGGSFEAYVDSDPKSDVARMNAWLAKRGIRWGVVSVAVGVACFFLSGPFG